MKAPAPVLKWTRLAGGAYSATDDTVRFRIVRGSSRKWLITHYTLNGRRRWVAVARETAPSLRAAMSRCEALAATSGKS